MKKLALCFLVASSLYGCSTDYKPATKEGAVCKAECAKSMAACQGSSYTCDRAASACISACKDLDALK